MLVFANPCPPTWLSVVEEREACSGLEIGLDGLRFAQGILLYHWVQHHGWSCASWEDVRKRMKNLCHGCLYPFITRLQLSCMANALGKRLKSLSVDPWELSLAREENITSGMLVHQFRISIDAFFFFNLCSREVPAVCELCEKLHNESTKPPSPAAVTMQPLRDHWRYQHV